MPLQPLQQLRAYQRIADQIADLVDRHELRPGDQLPAERDLARQLNVSRNVVREALVALELSRVIEVRVGVGAFILPRNAAVVPRDGGGAVVPDQGSSPLHLLQARRAIEGEIAFLAATMATAEDLERLRVCLEGIETHSEACLIGTPGYDWDRDFHVRLAETTRNPIFVAITAELFEKIADPIFTGLRAKTKLPRSPEDRAAHHRAIYEQVAAHDPAGARAALHRHLDYVARILFGDDSIDPAA